MAGELRARAGAAFRAGNLAAAENLLLRYVCLFPGDPAGYQNVLAIGRRMPLFGDELAEFSRRALLLNPATPDPLIALFTAYTDRGKDMPPWTLPFLDRYPAHKELTFARSIYLHRLGKQSEADGVIRRALADDPGQSGLYYQHGLQAQSAGDTLPICLFEKARCSAGAASRDYARAIEHLAANLHAAGDLPRAVGTYREALSLQPQSSELRANLAAALVDCGDASGAEEELRRLLLLSPENRDGLWLSSCLRIGAGDAQGGYRAHHVRWTEPHQGARTLGFASFPLWLGQPVEGKRILVWGDFGIGDEIVFLPMAQWLAERGAQVVLETDPRLVLLCRRSFPNVTVIGRKAAPDPRGSFDFHVPSALVARFYRQDSCGIGLLPLRADPQRVDEIRAALEVRRDDSKLVGFAWGGGGSRTSWSKSTELSDWSSLLEDSGIRLVSLQYAGGGNADGHGGRVSVAPVSDLRNDLEGLAALVECLDATVSISGINAHMAGALGRPGFVLMPRLPLWFWGRYGAEAPWYSSLSLFRRSDAGWEKPIFELTAALKRFLSP